MYLIEIKNFIKSKGVVTMYDLTHQFQLPHETLRVALDELSNKGLIEKIKTQEICCSDFKGCGNCVKLEFEIYKFLS